MVNHRIIGVGAGGHVKVVVDLLTLARTGDVIGLLDARPELWGTDVLGIRILGGDEMLPRLYQDGVRLAFVGVGGIKDLTRRRRVYELLRSEGFSLVAAIHPRAIVAQSVDVGDGPTIMAGAIVNAAGRLGDNVLINTGAIVEHDCVIGDHTHIASGARLAGNVVVGSGVHVGLGAAVREGIRIGDHALVGAGAVVVDDVPAHAIVVGVPAREMKRVAP